MQRAIQLQLRVTRHALYLALCGTLDNVASSLLQADAACQRTYVRSGCFTTTPLWLPARRVHFMSLFPLYLKTLWESMGALFSINNSSHPTRHPRPLDAPACLGNFQEDAGRNVSSRLARIVGKHCKSSTYACQVASVNYLHTAVFTVENSKIQVDFSEIRLVHCKASRKTRKSLAHKAFGRLAQW